MLKQLKLSDKMNHYLFQLPFLFSNTSKLLAERSKCFIFKKRKEKQITMTISNQQEAKKENRNFKNISHMDISRKNKIDR